MFSVVPSMQEPRCLLPARATSEKYLSLFLSNVLPPLYRFGTGDITDALSNNDASRKSGQIDIVVEMPWAPSFLMSAGSSVRLYPAEAVGTAIEIKSNLYDAMERSERDSAETSHPPPTTNWYLS